MTHTHTIAGWHPASLNAYLGRHWGVGARLKKRDETTIAATLKPAIPQATGHRKLSVAFVGMRGDIDNRLKSLQDALVLAGLLKDDSPKWLTLGSLTSEKGKPATIITLEDAERESS